MIWVALGFVFVAVAIAIGLFVRLRALRRALAVRSETAVPEDLFTRETLLSAALQAAESGIIITDRAGTVVFSNEHAQRFTGARHGEALADARVSEVLAEVRSSQRTAHREVDLYTPVRRVLGLSAAPLENGDGAVIFIDDLTERHRINEVRRDFVANVGHELKTPLGALSILAEALEGIEEPEKRRRLADRVTSEARRMANIIDDLLQLASLEAHGAPAEPAPVAAVLAAAVPPVQVAADDIGVKLVVEMETADLVITGDHGQLVSALSNLLDNAVKYTAVADRNGGEVRLLVHATPDEVTLTVRDQGVGIPQSDLDRIFERFYRVDRGRSRETGGTGLGLSIVRHVALNHGGRVEVVSEEGVGTTFTLRLPRWKE